MTLPRTSRRWKTQDFKVFFRSLACSDALIQFGRAPDRPFLNPASCFHCPYGVFKRDITVIDVRLVVVHPGDRVEIRRTEPGGRQWLGSKCVGGFQFPGVGPGFQRERTVGWVGRKEMRVD